MPWQLIFKLFWTPFIKIKVTLSAYAPYSCVILFYHPADSRGSFKVGNVHLKKNIADEIIIESVELEAGDMAQWAMCLLHNLRT